MSLQQDPSFYVAIFSSICFFASEILPFIPVKSNGIVHSLIECLKNLKNHKVAEDKKVSNDNENNYSIINVKLNNMNKKIDKIIEKINSEKNIV